VSHQVGLTVMRSRKRTIVILVQLLLITLSVTQLQPKETSAVPGDLATVSPGKFDWYLGTAEDPIVHNDYPNSTILTNTVGDLLFNITLNGPRSSISIYIPPEFEGLTSGNTTNIWTSVTNDYKFISVSKMPATDAIGPNWWKVTISTPFGSSIPAGWHLVKIFDLKAPSIAGRYFFKIFTRLLGSLFETSIGSPNFPTLVAKDELNPAYISGRVLYGGNEYYGYYYGLPVNVPGKVVAEGVTPQGRIVRAQAYFNASANGYYTIYGLALGTYNLTASAAGFPPVKMSRPVSVLAGQSLDRVDLYVYPGAEASGIVWSKCPLQPVQWGWTYDILGTPRPRPITIELLDIDGRLVAFTSGVTAPHFVNYNFTLGNAIEYDGHIPQDLAGYVSGFSSGDYLVKVYVNNYVQLDTPYAHVFNETKSIFVPIDLLKTGLFNVTIHFKDSPGLQETPTELDHYLVIEAYDLYGTLKGWNITWVPRGSTSSVVEITGFLGLFNFRGIRDYGLYPATYMIKAYMSGYMQLEIQHSTVAGYCNVNAISFEMVKGGAVNVTLYSVDWQDPRILRPWLYPGRNITIYFIDQTGKDWGSTYISQPSTGTYVSFSYYGTDYYALTKSPYVYYLGLHDTTLPTGTYQMKAYTPGYLPSEITSIEIAAGTVGDIRMNLIQGATIYIIMNFKTEGLLAPISMPERTPVRIEVFSTVGELVGASIGYVPPNIVQISWPAFDFAKVYGLDSYAGTYTITWTNYFHTTDGKLQRDSGLPADTFFVKAYVPGYEQKTDVEATVSLSGGATVIFDMERLAHVHGVVRWFNMFGNLSPLSWATISAYNMKQITTSSLDGLYDFWIHDGDILVTVALYGYETQTMSIHVTLGSETELNFNMLSHGMPIPELDPSATPLLFTVAFVSLALRKIVGFRLRNLLTPRRSIDADQAAVSLSFS